MGCREQKGEATTLIRSCFFQRRRLVRDIAIQEYGAICSFWDHFFYQAVTLPAAVQAHQSSSKSFFTHLQATGCSWSPVGHIWWRRSTQQWSLSCPVSPVLWGQPIPGDGTCGPGCGQYTELPVAAFGVQMWKHPLR